MTAHPDPDPGLDAYGYPVDMSAEERMELDGLACGDLTMAAAMLPEESDA